MLSNTSLVSREIKSISWPFLQIIISFNVLNLVAKIPWVYSIEAKKMLSLLLLYQKWYRYGGKKFASFALIYSLRKKVFHIANMAAQNQRAKRIRESRSSRLPC